MCRSWDVGLKNPELCYFVGRPCLTCTSDFQLIDVNAIKKASCALDVPTVPTSGGPRNENGDSNSGSGDTIFHGIIPSADYLLTFIIPAVIITCMLVLAILLACLLHKKRKAGKLNLFYSESLPPRVPVILQVNFFASTNP